MPDEDINQKTRNPVITNKNHTFKQLTNKPYSRHEMAYLMLYPLRNINLLHINKDINMKNLQTMKQSVQKGFTLIELMIVVAIIGILAALAIPAYTDYTIKSRVSEGASLMGATKTAVELYWSENGILAGPDGSSTITLTDLDVTTPSGEYVSAITVLGSITIPRFAVHYRESTALGSASLGCIEYVPIVTALSSNNIVWEVRAKDTYLVPGRNETIAVADCGTNEIVNKYKPKI